MRALALVALVGCVHAAQTPRVHLSAADQARAAVAIDIWCGENYPGTALLIGSGAIVSSRHILTARHVADACPGAIPEMHATLADGSRIRVVWYAYLHGDAALLQRADAGSWSWAQRPIVTSPGPHATVCAEAANPVRRRVCGEVTSLFVWERVRYEAGTIGGNSGSAVWDRLGHLVGVHSAHDHDGPSAYLQRLDQGALP